MEKSILAELTADIVAAHVSNNSVAVGDVSNLIKQVHSALAGLRDGAADEAKAKSPVVSIKASVRPEYLVCMECGAKQKTLKRHLQSAHGMTPATYKKDYGLPDSYPLTAPNYSEHRRGLAKSSGLGHKRAEKVAPKSNRRTKAKARTEA
jgi:predicted transcriptional regulator